VEIYEASVSLMVRSLVLSARWAGRRRRLCLEQAAANSEAGRIAELEARAGVEALWDQRRGGVRLGP